MGSRITNVTICLWASVALVAYSEIIYFPPIPPPEKDDKSPAHKKYVEEALKDPSKRKILDPEWSQTIEKLLHPPSLDIHPPAKDGSAFYTERLDWAVAGFGEVPYAAVLYDVRPPPYKKYSLEAGRACGAVLVAPAKVMAPCACVWEWLRTQNSQNRLTYSQFAIGMAEYDLETNTQKYFPIRVMLNKLYFDAYDNYTLVEELPNVIWYQDECIEAYQVQKRDWGEKYAQQHAVAFLKFQPELRDSPRDVFLTWPPNILDQETDEEFGTAQLVGFGLKKRNNKKVFHDDFGRELLINSTLITLKLRGECEITHVNGYFKSYYDWEVGCAYVSNRTEYELCEGLIGSLVVRKGIAFGIMIRPIDCNEGRRRVLIRPFYSRSYHLIEDKVGKDLLLQENAKEPILWRQPEPPAYVAYEVMPPAVLIDDNDEQYHLSRGAFLAISNLILYLGIFFISLN